METFDTTKWASDEFRAEILRREPLEESNTKRWIEVSLYVNGGNEVKFHHSSTYIDGSKEKQAQFMTEYGWNDDMHEYGTLPADDFERLKQIVNEKLGTVNGGEFYRVEVNLNLDTASPVFHLVFLNQEGDDKEVGVAFKLETPATAQVN